MADEFEVAQKSAGYSRRRINLRKNKERHESEYRSTDNSTSEYNAEFETQWMKNVLSENFRYIGHQGPILIMECIALLQGEDGELHLCGKRLRIRQGNYGNLARHKDLLHRHKISAAVNEMSSVMEDSMSYMPMLSTDILSNTLDHDNSIKSDEVKMEFLELIPDLESMVHACVKNERDLDQVYSASENSQEQCNSNSTSVPERRSVRTSNRINSKQKRFDSDVLTMYADGLPLDFTCKNSFRNLIADLDSNIRVKSQQYYLKKLDFAIRNQVRPQLHRLSKATEVGCCHFSLDVWGTAARIDVLAVRLHAITKEWVHIERTIAVRHCMTEQTIANIGEEFQKCLEAFDIPCEKVGMIITDDAVEMRKAFRLTSVLLEEEDETLEEEEENAVNSDGIDDSEDTDDDNEDLDFILDVVEDDSCEINFDKETVSVDWPVPHNVPSCVYELQLVIQDAVLSDAVAMQELCKVYKVISAFRRSTKWTTILRNKMTSISESQNKLWNLTNSPKTRWNSVLSGLQMLSDEMIHDAVQSTLLEAKLSSGNSAAKRNLAVHTLGSVAKLLELSYLLNGVGEATEYLTSGGVTAHKVMLIIIKAFKDLKETNVWYYHDLKKSLLEGLVKRFEPLLQSEEFVMATICDPRQKLRLFGGVQFGDGLELRLVGRRKAESILTEHYKLLEDKLNEPLGTHGEGFAEDVDIHFKATKRKRDIIDEIDIIAPVDKAPSKPTQSEVKIYLNEDCVSNEVDVLQYWKQSTIRFPILSKIAMRYLGIPTSSASLERDNFTRLYSRCCRRDRASTKVTENRVLYSEYKRYKHLEASSSSM